MKSVNDIKRDIYFIWLHATDPNMDGFVTWKRKQELYELLWYIEDSLDKCSTYAGEDEFLEQHLKDKMIKKLSK